MEREHVNALNTKKYELFTFRPITHPVDKIYSFFFFRKKVKGCPAVLKGY